MESLGLHFVKKTLALFFYASDNAFAESNHPISDEKRESGKLPDTY